MSDELRVIRVGERRRIKHTVVDLPDYLDSIIQVDCINVSCLHNLVFSGPDGAFGCNFKHITINDKGMCDFYERRNEKPGRE